MMADGGNSELGDVKEKKASTLLFRRVADDVRSSSSCCKPNTRYSNRVRATRLVHSESSSRSGRMVESAVRRAELEEGRKRGGYGWIDGWVGGWLVGRSVGMGEQQRNAGLYCRIDIRDGAYVMSSLGGYGCQLRQR